MTSNHRKHSGQLEFRDSIDKREQPSAAIDDCLALFA